MWLQLLLELFRQPALADSLPGPRSWIQPEQKAALRHALLLCSQELFPAPEQRQQPGRQSLRGLRPWAIPREPMRRGRPALRPSAWAFRWAGDGQLWFADPYSPGYTRPDHRDSFRLRLPSFSRETRCD